MVALAEIPNTASEWNTYFIYEVIFIVEEKGIHSLLNHKVPKLGISTPSH